MRLDYSDKMGAVRDAERSKPLQKNRPRKEPIGMFLFTALLMLAVGFGAGLGAGWFLFKGKQPQTAAVTAPAAQGAPKEAGAGVPATNPAQPQLPPQEPSLTFYQTLPSGGKGVMGSGMNLKVPEHSGQAKSAPAPAKPAAPPAGAAQPAEDKPAEKSAEKPAEKQGGEKGASEARFLVQIASYRDKQEAEAAQGKLSAKGVAAYLVESKVQGKGTWYRLRVGRHLGKEEAEQLAAKVGGGAAVLPE